MRIFSAIVERVKNALLISAANKVETDVALQTGEQKAELHRQAKQYDEEGLHELAADLREKAKQIDVARPLAVVLPGTGFAVGETGQLVLTAAAEPPRALPPAATAEGADEKAGKKKKAKAETT